MGKYADKIKEVELIIVVGYCLMGIGFFLYSLVNSIMTLFFVQILIGFAEAFYTPAFDALYSKHLDKNFAGREWGVWEAMNYFVIAAGAIIGGFIIITFGFNTAFILMAIISLISALYLYLLPRKLL